MDPAPGLPSASSGRAHCLAPRERHALGGRERHALGGHERRALGANVGRGVVFGTGLVAAVRRGVAFGTGLAAAMGLLGAAACAGSTRDSADASASATLDRRARMRALETAIARDHRTLERWISQPEEARPTPLHVDPALRELVARLRTNQHALEALRTSDASGGGGGAKDAAGPPAPSTR